jgi:hypothetical protein
MRPFRLLGVISVIAVTALASGVSLADGLRQGASAPNFQSAYVVSATDIPYPPQSIAVGTVQLEVIVSEKGKVENVLPIREIASLTEAALDSVKNWQFSAASLDGRPVRSRTTVAVTFNPAAIPAANVPLPPVSPNAKSRDVTVPPQPVDVLAASFPQYPINSVAFGTVVLRVIVDETGKVVKTIPARRIPSLTSAAIRVLPEWKFKPAGFEGTPVRSSITLAFVFRLPLPAPTVRPGDYDQGFSDRIAITTNPLTGAFSGQGGRSYPRRALGRYGDGPRQPDRG